MAEFDAQPFLASGDLQASQPPAEFQRNSYGFWAILSRPERGGRIGFMAIGIEAMHALSALYSGTSPKGLVIQEQGLDANPWGHWEEPLNQFAAERWDTPPEWLVLGTSQNRLICRRGDYVALGEDQAVESMNGAWRVIHRHRHG